MGDMIPKMDGTGDRKSVSENLALAVQERLGRYEGVPFKRTELSLMAYHVLDELTALREENAELSLTADARQRMALRYRKERDTLKAEVEEWKGNHDEQVRRKQVAQAKVRGLEALNRQLSSALATEPRNERDTAVKALEEIEIRIKDYAGNRRTLTTEDIEEIYQIATNTLNQIKPKGD